MRSLPRWLPLLLGGILLFVCWRALWFLCDDAFIAFRYVGNAHDGHGLVWNPAPFAAVEGYSCFLWVLLLWLSWAVTGIEPPVSANWLALAFAFGTLWLVVRHLGRDLLPDRPGWRTVLASAVALAIATNPTFVTWASSGLETAMFGCFATAWTLAACSRRRLLGLSTFAALAQLTRPDGGLLVLATLVIAGHALIVRRWTGDREVPVRGALRDVAAGLLPLAVPALHLGWRRWYYGEWVPNTYFAKVTSAWPESGLRYLYCFVVEHGVALWLGLAVLWCAVLMLRRGALRALCGAGAGGAIAVATWIGFVGYYTAIVGGDHFAFRPFAHLVPLLLLSLLRMLVSLRLRPPLVLAALAAFGIAANAFGWWHDGALRGRGKDGFVRASIELPSWLGAHYRDRDRARAWLRLHYVALPRGLHATVCADLLDLLPERRAGQVRGLEPGERGIYRTVAAGVVGWALPDVAILDAVGLNDRVIARNVTSPPARPFDDAVLGGAFVAFDVDRSARLSAVEIERLAVQLDLADITGVVVGPRAWADLLLALCDADGDGLDETEFRAAVAELQDTRHMAHERSPPAGYLEALRPNVVLEDGHFVVQPGIAPLRDQEIERIEREYAAKVGR
ncbi:MAG: hypothetical protein KDC98_23225 [Planctomycetes bacterium]|nr:hypothetical protein [Planctomycetota bacterium]